MKPKDIFSVAVRVIGLLFLYQGLTAVPAVINNWYLFPQMKFAAIIPSLIAIGWPLFIAWWMVRGAPWLMRLAYPEERGSAPSAPSATTPTNPEAGGR